MRIFLGTKKRTNQGPPVIHKHFNLRSIDKKSLGQNYLAEYHILQYVDSNKVCINASNRSPQHSDSLKAQLIMIMEAGKVIRLLSQVCTSLLSARAGFKLTRAWLDQKLDRIFEN